MFHPNEVIIRKSARSNEDDGHDFKKPASNSSSQSFLATPSPAALTARSSSVGDRGSANANVSSSTPRSYLATSLFTRQRASTWSSSSAGAVKAVAKNFRKNRKNSGASTNTVKAGNLLPSASASASASAINTNATKLTAAFALAEASDEARGGDQEDKFLMPRNAAGYPHILSPSNGNSNSFDVLSLPSMDSSEENDHDNVNVNVNVNANVSQGKGKKHNNNHENNSNDNNSIETNEDSVTPKASGNHHKDNKKIRTQKRLIDFPMFPLALSKSNDTQIETPLSILSDEDIGGFGGELDIDTGNHTDTGNHADTDDHQDRHKHKHHKYNDQYHYPANFNHISRTDGSSDGDGGDAFDNDSVDGLLMTTPLPSSAFNNALGISPYNNNIMMSTTSTNSSVSDNTNTLRITNGIGSGTHDLVYDDDSDHDNKNEYRLKPPPKGHSSNLYARDSDIITDLSDNNMTSSSSIWQFDSNNELPQIREKNHTKQTKGPIESTFEQCCQKYFWFCPKIPKPNLSRISSAVVRYAPCFFCAKTRTSATDRMNLTRLNMLCAFFSLAQFGVGMFILIVFLSETIVERSVEKSENFVGEALTPNLW